MARPVASVSRVVLVDKPAGPTSFDVVRAARRGYSGRVGHAGTLDPFATGLLLVLVGQATRLSQLFLGLPKEYELTIQFGRVSSTGDPMGHIEEREGKVTRHGVSAALAQFRGRITQQVPLTSAVKVGGEPLYKKAHRGEDAETPRREVTVYELSLLDFDENDQTARVLALTSSGTYLRVIAQDLGNALGVGGYAVALRRTRIGRFHVGRAARLDSLAPELYEARGRGVLSLDEALDHLPPVHLEDTCSRLAENGNELRMDIVGRFRAYAGGRLLAIYDGKAGVARPLVVFPGETRSA